jgi:IclR family mhp operon transcriptional activator
MARAAGIRSLERGLRVLQVLQMQPHSSLHDIFTLTRISKPSLLRILFTLEQAGVVTRRLADGRYRVGGSLVRRGQSRDRRDRIAEAAAPVLERLCQRVAWPSDLMVPAGDHMEICETSRSRSPLALNQERIGLPVSWLMSAVGRAYLAFCPEKERSRIIAALRASSRPEDHLARDAKRLAAVLTLTRERGYGTRDATLVGGYYGGPPQADGLFAIAVPLLDRGRVHGAINMLWLKPAYTVEHFAALHLADLKEAAAEIVRGLHG